MKRFSYLLCAYLFCLIVPTGLSAQTISKEELVFLTSEWKGERFEDGRPKIPDNIVERAKAIGLDDAWTILRNMGYNNQFEDGWKLVHDDVTVVGRALTATFMPKRPDIEKNILERGHERGYIGATNAWPIDMLQKGDVYVADGFGKVAGGTLIGQTLGNSIFNKSGNGVIFNGGARDLQGLLQIDGFNAFVRDFHPSFLEESVLMGLNTPTRIGKAIVMPGDLVLAEREGVLFIPAHLAEEVVLTAEFIVLRDNFGFEVIRNGRFTTGQIDSQWTDEIKEAFLQWLKENPSEGQMTREELDKLMEKRTW
ncbi:RraA family protein [Parapedobacter lycopersici]|uniref:RraA family protein n=1 Tax=Parapedobacter lycopersici TaxID=1864939 RepID=UPI00333F5510